MTQQPWPIESTYDRVAQLYTEAMFDELSQKPFDRARLDAFADRARHQSLVCDLGCGPGHVARYLKDKGLDVCGVDLSAAMVRIASQRSPDITFYKGDMRQLDFESDSFAGLVAFYSLIHLKRHEVPTALSEIYRVLRPNAPLLLAFHGGEGEAHADEWFGQRAPIDATLFTSDEMTDYLQRAGFQVESAMERQPYAFEYQSRRVYLHGAKPASPSSTLRRT